jgi:NAD(P)-dependent dehydrogenase (short-subunit alcohol dehydrogenase family)
MSNVVASGATVLVTGAGRGTGRAIALDPEEPGSLVKRLRMEDARDPHSGLVHVRDECRKERARSLTEGHWKLQLVK